MNVLIAGSGGRESALAWKIHQSPKLHTLYIGPGNAGSERYGIQVDLHLMNFQSVADFCSNKKIDVLIIGPEAPLVAGLTDYLKSDKRLSQLNIIGPGSDAALLEGSKSFAKKFMQKYHIPTADYAEFDLSTLKEGWQFLESLNPPYVLKADGLAAGKGVLIIDDLEYAKEILEKMLKGQFGSASSKVVIETFLKGTEFSVFVLLNSDSKRYFLLPEAKDYKRIGENDTGLNTGGMGAVSPVPFFNGSFKDRVMDRIIIPTLEGINKEGLNYKGFLFFGLINVQGVPYVIEYNCRLGDPETEVILPRLQSDLLELIEGLDFNKPLPTISFDTRHAATIMLTSGGYPDSYETGKEILGLDVDHQDSIVFHAGTKMDSLQKVLTHGGRVIAITSLATTFQEAVKQSLKMAENITYEGKYYRRDIGFDLE
ncbi:MAG TPA: phosphoribosylamine--glycine ligase [Saprospiraceae bacterium]|nr:phosphoribosylamine--glycine ligase [Saprospiraceae bacterium]